MTNVVHDDQRDEELVVQQHEEQHDQHVVQQVDEQLDHVEDVDHDLIIVEEKDLLID